MVVRKLKKMSEKIRPRRLPRLPQPIATALKILLKFNLCRKIFLRKKLISVTFSSNGKILLQEQLSAESKISYHIGLLYWKLLSYWTKTGFLKCYIFGPKFTKNDM
jgi:hypothetical protein